jgi:hypothetical protein
MGNLHETPRRKIETSEHAARGFVTCTCYGVIVWRGALSAFSASTTPKFDAIHCHDGDFDRIEQMLRGDTDQSRGTLNPARP